MASVFEKMEWFACASTRPKKVGLLKQFLEALGLPGESASKRVAAFNRKMLAGGHDVRFFQTKVQRAGKPPWVGTKDAFRAMYNNYV